MCFQEWRERVLKDRIDDLDQQAKTQKRQQEVWGTHAADLSQTLSVKLDEIKDQRETIVKLENELRTEKSLHELTIEQSARLGGSLSPESETSNSFLQRELEKAQNELEAAKADAAKNLKLLQMTKEDLYQAQQAQLTSRRRGSVPKANALPTFAQQSQSDNAQSAMNKAVEELKQQLEIAKAETQSSEHQVQLLKQELFAAQSSIVSLSSTQENSQKELEQTQNDSIESLHSTTATVAADQAELTQLRGMLNQTKQDLVSSQLQLMELRSKEGQKEQFSIQMSANSQFMLESQVEELKEQLATANQEKEQLFRATLASKSPSASSSNECVTCQEKQRDLAAAKSKILEIEKHSKQNFQFALEIDSLKEQLRILQAALDEANIELDHLRSKVRIADMQGLQQTAQGRSSPPGSMYKRPLSQSQARTKTYAAV